VLSQIEGWKNGSNREFQVEDKERIIEMCWGLSAEAVRWGRRFILEEGSKKDD
jgi:hypothetical protein